MEHKMTLKEYIILASMLFGMFFGAGNLIFPVSMGQQAGANLWPAIVGFCLTGVGIPLLGFAAMGMSESEGLFDMCSKVGKPYAYFFTTLLYLCIGPLFAIPRTATVSFSVGIQPVLHADNSKIALCIFSAIFFGTALFFALKPSGIMTWIGKILNPIFLVFLGLLAITALMNPMGDFSAGVATGNYVDGSFFQGFLEGYNTLDALASLAFGIVLINAIRELGVTSPKSISGSTLKSGFLSTMLMAAIYCMLTVVGAQSQSVLGISSDGGAALYEIGSHYFGKFGGILLGIIVTVACLKTALGLIVSCSEAFVELFPGTFSYKTYAVIFSLVSFTIANFGLNRILELSLPVLMFLYPLTITLILLCLFGHWFQYDRRVFVTVTIFTILPAILDFFNALPTGAKQFLHLNGLLEMANMLPFFSIGMGWIIPAGIGLVIGICIQRYYLINIGGMKMPNLERFLIAQEINYDSAREEIRRGKKTSHWMWYVFPQITGLSSSGMGRKYAIANLAEAKEYAAHDILGKRLKEMCELLLTLDTNDAYEVLGSPDNMKLKSSMTLFAMAEPECDLYQKVLDKYYKGEMDKRTVQLMKLLKGLY